MINYSKATWLTSRGNHYGKMGKLTNAIEDFKAAIKFKADHLPAHLGLAIAYQGKGLKMEAIEILAFAPEEMKLHGEIVANKKDVMSALI